MKNKCVVFSSWFRQGLRGKSTFKIAMPFILFVNFCRHDLWSRLLDLFRFHANCPNASAKHSQIMLFGMVVYSSVEPCKQNNQYVQWNLPVECIRSTQFFTFFFIPSRLPENTEAMNVINSTLTVIVTASIYLFIYFRFCDPIAHPRPRTCTVQFTIHNLPTHNFYCYLCEHSNESKYPTDFNNEQKKNYYNFLEFVFCEQNKWMLKRVTCCRLLWMDIYSSIFFQLREKHT